MDKKDVVARLSELLGGVKVAGEPVDDRLYRLSFVSTDEEITKLALQIEDYLLASQGPHGEELRLTMMRWEKERAEKGA